MSVGNLSVDGFFGNQLHRRKGKCSFTTETNGVARRRRPTRIANRNQTHRRFNAFRFSVTNDYSLAINKSVLIFNTNINIFQASIVYESENIE